MINVLYVADTLRRRFGVTSVIMNYLKHFLYDEIQVDLLVFGDSEKEVVEEIEGYGCKVYYMPFLSIRRISHYVKFLREFFHGHCYNIVHSHFNQIDALIFDIAKKNGVKVTISHSHSTVFSYNRMKAIRNYILCLPARKRATYWAACGEAAGKAFYGKKYMLSSKKLIINNAIDCNKFDYNLCTRNKVRDKLGIKEEICLIGCIGSFQPRKNQMYLIEIIDRLVKKHVSDYVLIFAGAGEDLEKAKNVVKTKDLGNHVIFLGAINYVCDLLQGIDILVMPSLYEGLPVSAIEAQVAGVPCIISDNVTMEVAICNTKFLSLNMPDKWVESIIKSREMNRKSNLREVGAAGFDIRIEARKLEKIYVSMTQN